MAEIKSDVNHIHTLPDFVQGGLDYLPGDFLAEKVNLVTFLTVYLKRLEDVDKMLVGLAEGRLLNNASGRYLDEVGNQLGILRNGLSDADFRATLIIQQAAASRGGTREDVISTLRQLFGRNNFDTWKGDNFRFDINIRKTCFDILQSIDQILDMLPLPCHLRLTESQGQAFGFEGDHTALGFGSVWEENQFGVGGLTTLLYVPDVRPDWDTTTIYCESITVNATRQEG